MRTQLINFMIPNKLLTQVDELAREQYKSRSDILREAARRIVEEAKQEEQDFETIFESATRINLPQTKAIELVEQTRSSLQMNK